MVNIRPCCVNHLRVRTLRHYKAWHGCESACICSGQLSLPDVGTYVPVEQPSAQVWSGVRRWLAWTEIWVQQLYAAVVIAALSGWQLLIV
jgi:hypothetical protein